MNVMKLLAASCLIVLFMTGCTTVTQTYDGHPPDQVWLAMKTVAQSPAYDDWHVRENDVWVDESGKRIEIYRKLYRKFAPTVAKTRYEERDWKFRILLEKENPPTVTFTSRAFAVPAHARLEAERYFKDVLDILSAPRE